MRSKRGTFKGLSVKRKKVKMRNVTWAVLRIIYKQ